MRLDVWIKKISDLCQPKDVHICNGSRQEYESLCHNLVESGTFYKIPNRLDSYGCRSDPSDVARVEERTFICSLDKDNAGPTNIWADPTEMRSTLMGLFAGSMRGRTMYVIPFMMGRQGSPFSIVGVQITDSPYVVVNSHIMANVGDSAMQMVNSTGKYIPCVHSVGYPLNPGMVDPAWPCRNNIAEKYIVHFPESREIWSYGSGYGGNALLCKKSLALRIASVIGHEEGWLAEHMLILEMKNPAGKKKYIAAAFPSSCGKTNLAMLDSPIAGWSTRCVGDDVAWIRAMPSGMVAMNPEAGFFGIAYGTSHDTNPRCMEVISRNSIFTNVATDPFGNVWWEGLTKIPPEHLTDWNGAQWSPDTHMHAAHPNSRFTSPVSNLSSLSDGYYHLGGVPISAIIFGGRDSKLTPLIVESKSWAHGIFLGASLSSEQTAASFGRVGEMRRDPFAMKPFCGYHICDYFAHWISMAGKVDYLPKIYKVNWYRLDKQGKYIWPGFKENMKVLKWIFERCDGSVSARNSPLGKTPEHGIFHENLFYIDREAWLKEVSSIRKYFTSLGLKLPKELKNELSILEQSLH